MEHGTAAASSYAFRLRPMGAMVARQIPALKVARSNRVSVTPYRPPVLVDGTPTGTASTTRVVADPRNGRLIKLLTPYSSRVVGNRLGARLANDSATFFGPPVR